VTKNRDYHIESKVLSTFDYFSTIQALEEVYQNYSCIRKTLLAPTGSKLQTVAAFIFRQMHPDVQIVYPVTKQFKLGEYEYSQGCREIWGIHFNGFLKFTSSLESYRKQL